MKFAVIGGDRRSAWLCALLEGDGHRVYTYALEKAELPKEVPKAGCLQGCVYGADWVILPTPAERGGVLNAPYSSEQLRLEEIISALWPGQVLCGGKLSQSTAVGAVRAGLQVVDLMQRRDFAVGNAAITAEGAAELMMKSGERCLWGSRVLVTGWGRVAKILALRLYALGALVTVAARKDGDRAMARALGLDSCDFDGIYEQAEEFDFVANTVPARVLEDDLLALLRPDAVLLELASPPGGFDAEQARSLGLPVLAAPGLPGVYAPYTAAELMRETIYTIISDGQPLRRSLGEHQAADADNRAARCDHHSRGGTARPARTDGGDGHCAVHGEYSCKACKRRDRHRRHYGGKGAPAKRTTACDSLFDKRRTFRFGGEHRQAPQPQECVLRTVQAG